MFFFIWLFVIRYCAYQGSKRVIGAVDATIYAAFFNIWGMLMVFSSRRLDTAEAITNLDAIDDEA